MAGIREWTRRLLGTFGVGRSDRDLEEELRAHLEMAEADVERRGHSAVRRSTALRHGGISQAMDAQRDQRASVALQTIARDARYAMRMFGRQPKILVFGLTALTLALTLAISLFSVLRATIVRPVPGEHPERLYAVSVPASVGARVTGRPAPLQLLPHLRTIPGVVAASAYADNVLGSVVDDGVLPRRTRLRYVSDAYLSLFELQPTIGREFVAADTSPSAPAVVMLGHSSWVAQFGADRAVIGRTLHYDDRTATIVGVAPDNFFPAIGVWAPLRTTFNESRSQVVVRLAASESPTHIESVIASQSVLRSIRRGADPSVPTSFRLSALVNTERSRYRDMATLLVASVSAIVAVAWINISGLLLLHGTSRREELAIRKALGASRSRLVRQLLTEHFAIALLASAAALCLARLSVPFVLSLLPLRLGPGIVIRLDGSVILATLALALSATFVCGLVPALVLSSNTSPGAAAGARVTASRLTTHIFTACQLSIAVVLTMVSGLLMTSYSRLLAIDMGFSTSSMLAFVVQPARTDPQLDLQRHYSDLLDDLRRMPGVTAVGAVDHFPLGETSFVAPASSDTSTGSLVLHHATDGYLEVMDAGLLAGRFLTAADLSSASPVAVVNAMAARQFLSPSPIGEFLDITGTRFQVVGIVSDVLSDGPAGRVRPEAFVPASEHRSSQSLAAGLTVVVRGRDSASLRRSLQDATTRFGLPVVVDPPRSGDELLAGKVYGWRQQMLLLTALAAVGLGLALMGVFASTAYAVARRRREIGVRMALGALPAQVVRLMLRDVSLAAVIGVGSGLAISALAATLVRALLFDTNPTDAATFVAVTTVMIATTSLAAWLPARGAARIDPSLTLKSE